MKRYIFATALAFLVVVLPGRDAVRASGSFFTVEDLGDVGGLVPTVTGMNASGQVSGYINTDLGPRAVRYSNGAGWEFLDGVGAYSLALGINASGDVVGYHLVEAGVRAFRYSDGPGVTTFEPLPDGFFTVGFAINASGEVTGYGDTPAGTRAWRAAPGLPLVVLPTLGGDTMSCGINDAGEVVGSATTAGGASHAFRVAADNASALDIVPVDGPAANGNACAIDADGRVGGSMSIGGASRAFRFDGVAPVSLDTFASTASAVTSIANGVSAGWFVSSTVGTTNAFIHSDANGSRNLNDLIAMGSGWQLEYAYAINTAGQVAGNGTFDGTPRAFRLTPVASEEPDTTAPVISEISATPSNIWPPNGALVDVAVLVTATDDSTAPVCSLSSLTSSNPRALGSVTDLLSARVQAVGGTTYTLNVTCTDAAGNSRTGSTSVVVPPDTTAPVITQVSSTPSTVWPPNGELVDVAVAVTATDDSGSTPVCSLSSLTSSMLRPLGSGITGQLSARVRAVGGTAYFLNVTCTDAAGNSTRGSTSVVVPRDATAPVIMNVHATPDAIWPPNGKMIPVTVSVTATDDVDSAPQCYLTSVSGGSSNDAVKTGQFTADVRSEKNADGSVRVYSLNVQCSDAAGNKSHGVATVVVGKDSVAVTAFLSARVEKVMKQLKALQKELKRELQGLRASSR